MLNFKVVLQKNIFYCFFAILFLPVFLLDDWLGWTFLFLNFILLFWIAAKSYNRYLVALLIIFIMHQVFSIILSFFIPVMGDMARVTPEYLSVAKNMLSFPSQNGFINYSVFLSLWYKINPSILLGCELSDTAFLFFCLLFIKIAEKFQLKNISYALLTFSLLPSVMLYTSVILREGFEICFFCAMIYYGLLWKHQQQKTSYLILTILFGFFAILLHNAFLYVTLFFLGYLLFFPMKLNFSRKNLLFISVMCLGLGFFVFYQGSTSNEQNDDNDFTSKILVNSSSSIEGATTNYVEGVAFHDVNIHFILFLFLKLFYFLFGPFFWQINQMAMLGLMVLSWFRAILIYRSIRFYRQTTGEVKKMTKFLLVTYALSIFVWSVGVVNYGTAIRHLILSDWMIFMLGFQPKLKNNNKSTPILLQTLGNANYARQKRS